MDEKRAFVRAITGDAMRRHLSRLTSDNEELRTLSRIVGQDLLFEWAHSIGVVTDREIRETAPPVPPSELLCLTGSGRSELGFLSRGLADCKALWGHYARHAGARGGPVAALDFGCGCGRLLRFLVQHPDLRVFGSEIIADHVDWCRTALPGATVTRNGALPPLDLDRGSIDFAFAYSLFTHFSQAAAQEWLDELARVVRPGGIVLVTTHGEASVGLIADNPARRASFGIGDTRAAGLLDELRRDGFVFLESDEAALRSRSVGENYGTSFVSESFVRRNWPRDAFAVAEIVSPGSGARHDIGLRQDIVILRRL